MSLYTMKLSDSVDTMEFNLLEVPIQDKDIEGAVDNVVLSGDIYTDFLWLKKRFTHKWSILCKNDYERLRGFYTRQFSNAEVPIYQLLDAPSPIEESAGSGEYIQITTTDSTAKLASVEMLGKAEQTTYSGKNLMPLEPYRFGYYYGEAVGNQINYDVTSSAHLVTFTPKDDGTSTLAATASWRGMWFMSQALTAGTYYLNLNGATTTGNLGASVYVMDSDHKITRQILNTTAAPITNQLQMAITLAEGETYISVGIGVRTTAGTITLGTLMLSAGSTATAYEPYVGGTPAPNPSFPQPISVVTGENVVKVEGKNLFDKDMTPVGSWHLTKETTQSGLKLTSTASGGVCYTYYEFPFRHSESVDVTISFQKTGTGFVNIYFRDENGNAVKSASNQTSTFTILSIPSTAVLAQIYFYGDTSAIGKVTTYDSIQLELGSTATTFEPYQGQEFEVNLGKNLLDPTELPKTQVGVTGTYQNGIFSLSGTASIASNFYILPYDTGIVHLEAGESLTLYLERVSGTSRVRFLTYFVPDDGSTTDTTWGVQLDDNESSKTVVKTATKAGSVKYVQFFLASGVTYDSQVKILVQRGNITNPTWSPYFTPIELAKIGNYQDRIYKDSGKWYIEKQVGKVVLDGAEAGWSWADTARYTITTANIGAREAISDHFTYVDYTGHASTASPSFDISSNLAGIGFHDKDITSLNNFKTWLSTHNTTIYYALATPTTTEITNEALIAQLEALGASSLYVGVNNIGTETQNAMPTLALTYFPYYPHEIISPKAVRMELTDGGIINACECRENVQITLRETIQ